jgi:hypothetical protein
MDDYPTDEEMLEILLDIQMRDAAWDNWIASNRKCQCGEPIEFEDAYQHGACLACLQASQLEEHYPYGTL